jgi:hypothetical protein
VTINGRLGNSTRGPLRCLVQFIVALDPSKLASSLVDGHPGEATELGLIGASGSSVPKSSVGSHGASCFRYLALKQVPRRNTIMWFPCTSTLRFEWVISKLPDSSRHTPTPYCRGEFDFCYGPPNASPIIGCVLTLRIMIPDWELDVVSATPA